MFFNKYKFVFKKIPKSDVFFIDNLYFQLNLNKFKTYHLKIDEINLLYFLKLIRITFKIKIAKP